MVMRDIDFFKFNFTNLEWTDLQIRFEDGCRTMPGFDSCKDHNGYYLDSGTSSAFIGYVEAELHSRKAKYTNPVDLYLDRLKTELKRTFGSGYITVYVDYEPTIISCGSTLNLIACDFFCENPPAEFSLNIIVSPDENYTDLDEPLVMNARAAKNLLDRILLSGVFEVIYGK